MGTTDSHRGHTIHRVGTEAPNEKTAVGASPLLAGALQYNFRNNAHHAVPADPWWPTQHDSINSVSGHRVHCIRGKVKLTIRPVFHQGKGQTPHPACISSGERSNSPSSLYSRAAGSWSSCGSWPLVDTGMLWGILQHRQHPHLCQHRHFFGNLFQSPLHQLLADCFNPHYI